MALAASGNPDKVLTLTVNAGVGAGATDRRNLLHDAWKRLVKRILRQFALPPERRWTLTGDGRSARKAAILLAITTKTPRLAYRQMHYMAFLERTKAGEPHLHILLRCPYVPQDWLAEQMLDMLASPVVWIEQVRGVRSAIRYLTKYITKEPAQFGRGKRYWVSRGYEVDQGEREPREPRDMRGVRVVRENWQDKVKGAYTSTYRIEPLEDGWQRWYQPRSWRQANEFSDAVDDALRLQGVPAMSRAKPSGGVWGDGDSDPHGFAARCSSLETPF